MTRLPASKSFRCGSRETRKFALMIYRPRPSKRPGRPSAHSSPHAALAMRPSRREPPPRRFVCWCRSWTRLGARPGIMTDDNPFNHDVAKPIVDTITSDIVERAGLEGLQERELAALIGSRGSSDFIRASGPSPRQQAGHMTEGRQPFHRRDKNVCQRAVHILPIRERNRREAHIATAGLARKDVRSPLLWQKLCPAAHVFWAVGPSPEKWSLPLDGP